MKVPLIQPDLPTFSALKDSFRQILGSGRITNFGRYLNRLEQETGAYLGVPTVVLSSGTMGLVFTLQALGLRAREKVALPSFSFMATAQAVLYAGGIPVFAEVGGDLTMSPSDLEELLAKHRQIRVVLPVHMYGLPCPVEEIRRVVEKAQRRRGSRLHLVYDAAHAFGSQWKGRSVGTFGQAEVFSLSVTKALVSVEGGLVSSRNPELVRRIRKMRNYGIEENYNAGWPGMNGKMSEFHALIGLENLRQLDRRLAIRARKAAFYTSQIESKTCFRTIPVPADVTHTFKDFTILIPPELKARRGAIMHFLAGRGIETRAYFYPPIHEQRFFRRFSDRPLPVTEDLSRRVITLPFFTSISEGQMKTVVAALQQAERRRA